MISCMMNLVFVPKIRVSHLSVEGTGTTARAEGGIWEPPFWGVHVCLFVGPQRPGK